MLTLDGNFTINIQGCWLNVWFPSRCWEALNHQVVGLQYCCMWWHPQDYHEQNYYDVLLPKSVDVIYDCVGQTGTGDHAFNIIKSHGSFVTSGPQRPWSVLRVETTFFHPTPMVDQRFPPWNGHNLKVSHPFFGTHITIITRLTTTIFLPHKNWRFWGHHGEAVTTSKGLDFHQTSSAMFGNTLPPALGVVRT